MKKIIILILIHFLFVSSFAQLTSEKKHFTRRDSLKGGLRFERTCYDVKKYNLNIKIQPEQKKITGYNEISFKVNEKTSKIQVDLFENMKIDSIVYQNKRLQYTRDFLATFIQFPQILKKNTSHSILFYYSGLPTQAKRAPWDGGFTFTKDKNNTPWIAVSCQGFGASSWIPIKDSQSDEPDEGMDINIEVPNYLTAVCNGKLVKNINLNNGYTSWQWRVNNPINSYNITVNIGDYIALKEQYKNLELTYYVLKYNKNKASQHFEQVKPMMDCFQSKFGTYPFETDGYKLVETPYLGMEHQSAIAYGNEYQMGYKGQDLSGTQLGLLFDYIIIHETGHEWFGNSITSKDIADMWIHEAFTMYSEVAFLECNYGYDKAMQYCYGLQNKILNDRPMIGVYGVNYEGSGDMYYKGANMLNTIRHIIGNDKWWSVIYRFATTFKKQIVTTSQVIDFFNKATGKNLTPVFNQYLNYTLIPKLEIRYLNKKMEARWITNVANFEMPLELKNNQISKIINISNQWTPIDLCTTRVNDITYDLKKYYIEY